MARIAAPAAVSMAALLFAAACASTPPPPPAPRESAPPAEPLRKTFQSKDEAVAAMRASEPKAPRPGDFAPDFALTSEDGRGTVRLAEFRGKSPVVLVFGSYT